MFEKLRIPSDKDFPPVKLFDLFNSKNGVTQIQITAVIPRGEEIWIVGKELINGLEIGSSTVCRVGELYKLCDFSMSASSIKKRITYGLKGQDYTSTIIAEFKDSKESLAASVGVELEDLVFYHEDILVSYI